MAAVDTGNRGRSSALELWHSYAANGDVRVRDRLVLTFAPMVKYIVYRKVREIPARCELEDFIEAGLRALIGAIEGYDPRAEATLEQFAWTQIHGAVLGRLRQNRPTSASTNQWQRDSARVEREFTSLYGRRPTTEELSDAMGPAVKETATASPSTQASGDVSRR